MGFKRGRIEKIYWPSFLGDGSVFMDRIWICPGYRTSGTSIFTVPLAGRRLPLCCSNLDNRSIYYFRLFEPYISINACG